MPLVGCVEIVTNWLVSYLSKTEMAEMLPHHYTTSVYTPLVIDMQSVSLINNSEVFTTRTPWWPVANVMLT